MKRWKALTSVALAAALVIAPLVSAGAIADEPLVGKVGVLQTWTKDTNDVEYWENLYKDHNAQCYKSEGNTDDGKLTDGKLTVTLNDFNQNWPGDHWELLVIKAGNLWNNVIVHPEAGVAYASPANNGEQQAQVSHWIVCKGETPGAATASFKVTTPSCADVNGLVFVTHTHSTVTSITLDGKSLPVEGLKSGEYPDPAPGVYVIVLTADPYYGFGPDKAATKTLTFTVPASVTSDSCVVTPVDPTWVDACGPNDGHWTYPANPVGYSYKESTVGNLKVLDIVKAEGYKFPADTVTHYAKTDSNEPCVVVYPVPALFNAAPEKPSCTAAGSFSTAFLGQPGEDGRYSFENVWVTVDRSTPGAVKLKIEAKPGFTLTGLSENWVVNQARTSATRTIVLAAQLSGPEACPLAIVPAPAAPTFTDVCGTDNDELVVPADTADYVYESGQEGDTFFVEAFPAVAGNTFPVGTVTTWEFTSDDEVCPTTTSTTPTPAALPATGGVDMLPWGIGGAAMLLAGAAALIMTRRFARR